MNLDFNDIAAGDVILDQSKTKAKILSEIGSDVRCPYSGVVSKIDVVDSWDNRIYAEIKTKSKKDKMIRFYYLNEFFFDLGCVVKKGQIVGFSGKNGVPCVEVEISHLDGKLYKLNKK